MKLIDNPSGDSIQAIKVCRDNQKHSFCCLISQMRLFGIFVWPKQGRKFCIWRNKATFCRGQGFCETGKKLDSPVEEKAVELSKQYTSRISNHCNLLEEVMKTIENGELKYFLYCINIL